jgi:hypothetical protein
VKIGRGFGPGAGPANYWTLDQFTRHRIDTRLIAIHWGDLLRVTG